MRLGAPCTTRYAFFVRSTPGCPTRVPRPRCRVFVVVRMLMAGQLLDRKGCAAHSAGNTRPPPSTPRLPGLRRGSHNAPHSTAADCWQPRIWHLTGYAYGAGCRLFVRSRDRNQRPMSLMPEPKNFQSLFQIQRRQTYEYGWRAAPPTAWSRRQCRKDIFNRRHAA